ncbi:hypothetical protein [Pelagibius sp.]|uniref:hypothetical protein n=1 Tax=Pelagibius sp. TaxID=1931238 RepID=UPI0026246164|nr:hypothetical protein [Pelagibius sp.]
MPKFFRASLLALATSVALIAPASADIKLIKNYSFGPSNSYLNNPPALVFVPKSGKYEMEKPGNYQVKLHLKAEKKWNARITNWEIVETSAGGGMIASHGFAPTSLKKLNKTVTLKIGPNKLKHFEAKGRKVCQQHGKPDEKVVKISKDVRFEFSGYVMAKNKNRIDVRKETDSVSIKIVCMPEPFAVNDVKLSVKFNGSPLSCPVKATLKAEFKGNKPGTFTFRIFRGDGATQDVTRTIGSAGKVSFTKHYTFNKSADRKYLIAVIGHPIATQWVPMKVHCGKKIDGFKAPTKPHTTNH